MAPTAKTSKNRTMNAFTHEFPGVAAAVCPDPGAGGKCPAIQGFGFDIVRGWP
jgi:hypothetical protein